MRLSEPTTVPFRAGGERDVAVLMSGGVDSSVAALRLRDDGWNVVGVTMLIPSGKDGDARRPCCGTEAAYVCSHLGIPHYFLDVRDEFRRLVVEPFREWYSTGRTPSPCVDCNTDLKFGLVWDVVRESLGVRRLATGHYAQVVCEDGRAYLVRAEDRTRDQSYFLYGVRREMLPYLTLPLGNITKTEVRAAARNVGLPVARRSDSMELCFADSSDYREALGDQSSRPGSVLDEHGAVIGTHTGVANYTIGQRKGLGIAGGRPLFVCAIDPVGNTITVAGRDRLYKKEVSACGTNALIPELVRPGEKLLGKVRSANNELSPCEIAEVDAEHVSVVFEEPVFAPAPGQRLVLYDCRDRVVAGGVIRH